MEKHNRRLLVETSAPTNFDPSSIPGFDPFTLLAAKEAAAEVRLSLPAFWKQVAGGRLPAPVYPSPRAPRWLRSELRAAVMGTRALPRDQSVARNETPRNRWKPKACVAADATAESA
jgi:predicted DNA-binding transcriptional regulator AlpA